MSVEMIVLVPVLLMVVLIAVAGGRYVSAEGMTRAAARDAARAASLERSSASAAAAASAALARAQTASAAVPYTPLRAHETSQGLVCRLLLEKKKQPVFKKPAQLAVNVFVLNEGHQDLRTVSTLCCPDSSGPM